MSNEKKFDIINNKPGQSAEAKGNLDVLSGNCQEKAATIEPDTYPFIHAMPTDEQQDIVGADNDFEESMMRVLYGSPEILREYGSTSKHRNTDERGNINEDADSKRNVRTSVDLEETVQICSQCGNAVPMSAHFCTYCGNDMRSFSRQIPPMACVYASPEMMQKTNKRESFLDKLFKRKK